MVSGITGRPCCWLAPQLLTEYLEGLLGVDLVVASLDLLFELRVLGLAVGVLAADRDKPTGIVYVAQLPVPRALFRPVRYQRRQLFWRAIEDIHGSKRLLMPDRADFEGGRSRSRPADTRREQQG